MKTIYLSVVGDIVSGIKVYGPFDTSCQAHDFNQNNLQINDYVLTHLEVNDIEYDDKQDLFTIATGNCFDGLEFEKLSKDDIKLGETCINYEWDWFIIKLYRPE